MEEADSKSSPIRSITTLCISAAKIRSKGIFSGKNPLHYATTLLWLQLFSASATIMLTVLLLKPFGQPVLFSQILGGIILGPSVLGRSHAFTNAMFPLASFILLDTIGMFGIMFYLFLIGVQMDPWMLKYIGKRELVVGILVIMVPLVLTGCCSVILTSVGNVDKSLAKSLAAVGAAESVLSFPTVAGYLSELKILNSELGRVALSSSMVTGALSFSTMSMTILVREAPGKILPILTTILTAAIVVMLIVLVARLAVIWMIRRNPEGQPIKEEYIYGVMLGVLVTGFIGKAVGLNVNFGPLIFGLAIPSGPPLGSALVDRLNVIITLMFMPIYFVRNGLSINIFAVGMKNFAIVLFMVFVSCTGKFIGVLLPSLYFRMPLRDALSLGLVMTTQGVLEVDLFKKLNSLGLIHDEAYVSMCVSMLFNTGVLTPLIRNLHNPSRRFVVHSRRTILHSIMNVELRVLVCIHDQDHVPSMINLLQASNPTKDSPIGIYIIHMIELLGRASPLLVAHKPNRKPSSSNVTPSGRIINAFRQYEHSNKGAVSVHPFTTISPYETMHNDISMIALDRGIALIIVPFHKQYGANGTLGWSRRDISIVNKNILNDAPCSVGILINRGLLVSSKPLLARHSIYHVAILFLGGADDREALALGVRMAGHPSVSLTVIRVLGNGMESSNDLIESEQDNVVVNEFRLSLADNDRFVYIEEEVMDGLGTVSVIRSMENSYELILVGRSHDKWSPLLTGLIDWSEYNELGAIGEMFASKDFKGKTTILVVQQHQNVAADLNIVMDI